MVKITNCTFSAGTEFEGGRGAWRVSARCGDVHLTLVASGSDAAATVCADLSDDDIEDLELALGRAREARAAWHLENRRAA